MACGGKYSSGDVSPDRVVVHAEFFTNFLENRACNSPCFLNEHGKLRVENFILSTLNILPLTCVNCGRKYMFLHLQASEPILRLSAFCDQHEDQWQYCCLIV